MGKVGRWPMGIVARSGACGTVAGLLLLIPLFSSPAGMNVSAQTTQRTTVSFDVVAFDLPGLGWQQSEATPLQIGYTRKMGGGKFQSIGFWPVTFPPSLQGRSQQEHTSAYFDIERQKPRYEGRWEGFVEGTREIAGRQFPTMRFTMTLAAQRFVVDGLFVLYFPDDFDQRRKFFTFMWLDGHPQDQPGTGLEVLDATVASTRINHSTAPSAPVSEAKPELRLGYSTWVGYGPLFLAREKKYLDEAGIRVALARVEDPKRRFAALADGELDGLVTTMDTMILYWRPTFQFQAVLGLADSNGGDGIIAKDSIKSIPDLRGMKVAYNEGSVSHFFLSVLLRENGMTEKDIQGVNMRQDDAGAAFMSHKVDAAVTWEPWLTKAKNAPGGHILVDSSRTPGLIMDVLLFRREVIKSRPDAIRAVIKGWYRAVDYWKKNPDESTALMAKEVGDWLKDVKTFRETLGGVRYYDQAINEQYFAPGGQIYVTAQKALEIWTALGHSPLAGAATDLVEPEFVRER